jgi:hypothetical protein
MPSRVDCCDMLLLRKERNFSIKKNITIVGVVWTLLLPVLEMCGLKKISTTTIFADQKFTLFW